MNTCLYCLGEVPDAAVKCRHCGEWLHDGEVRGGNGLRNHSERNPSIHAAEQNAENIRFVWKGGMLVCVAALVMLLYHWDSAGERMGWFAVVVCSAIIFLGVLNSALLSAVSHIVQLLAVILRNQLHRENQLASKVRRLEQSLHE